MYGKLNFATGQMCLVSKSFEDLAKRIVNSAIEEEQGKDAFDIKGYLEGWVETLNECSDDVVYTMADVSCQASDNLVYSNAHYYNGRTPLTSSETSELCLEVECLLDKLIDTLQLV
jgi:hypothetical protein